MVRPSQEPGFAGDLKTLQALASAPAPTMRTEDAAPKREVAPGDVERARQTIISASGGRARFVAPAEVLYTVFARRESGGEKYGILPFTGEISYRSFTGFEKYF